MTKTEVLLVGGDRRQTALLGLLRGRYRTAALSVPETPDTAEKRPYACVVLPCPSFGPEGRVRGCALTPEALEPYLDRNTTVLGGWLDRWLSGPCARRVDLLRDEEYLARNARLTAEAAPAFVMARTGRSLCGAPCLVVGFGRIGRRLAPLCGALGGTVTVAARRAEVRAEAEALGFSAAAPETVRPERGLIFNTVPAVCLPERRLSVCRSRCLWVELASAPGGLPPDLAGDWVLPAGGLPGRMLPVSAAELLAAALEKSMR